MWAVAVALLLLQTPDYSSEGLKALDEGKYQVAVDAFTKAISADPKDYTAHFNLALAYSFLHKDTEGIAEYRKTLELKPGLYEAELNGGILLLRQKNPAEAAPLLEKAAEQKPKEFRPRYYAAEAQLATGALDKAGESYRQALELNPKSADAELGLAHALARRNQLADAAPHFRQAAQLDPKYRDNLLELAELYEQSKQPAEAIAIYREFPDNPAAQEHLGELLLESKQYAEAIPRLEAVYTKSPTEANRTALAMAYLFNHQLEQALPLLEQAVAVEPSNCDLRLVYARALRDRKLYPAAANQFLAAAKLKPAEAQTWSELGAMLYLMGQYEPALGAFDRARGLGENTPGNWFLRAIILDKLKQIKPALEAYRQFLSMSQGKNPDQEFQARQRARILERELEKR
jgi:Tfp pilus assembly protein PilF